MESFFGILIFNSVINSKISIQTCILYEAKIRPTSLIHFISFSTHTRQPEDGQTKTSCPLNNHANLKQILEQSCVNWKNLSFLANNWTGCIPLQWTYLSLPTIKYTWVFTRVPHGTTKQWMIVCSQPSFNTQSG